MKKLSCQEIREAWVNFFKSKSHKHIASASLVPDNPTLLLNAAGMVQFVPIFMGTKPPPEPPRAVTIQKCARVGGKDSDLENIGRTTRHHSFFEMLGNFSFGDYFKAEAIEWAWQFVREDLGMPAEKLYVSVFEGDDSNAFDKEAFDIWMKILEKDFPDQSEREKRIWKMSRKDNFWGPPGATGPCGPCSEIYYDTGSVQGGPDVAPLLRMTGAEFDNRFIEIWNLVFMEFEKDEDGKFTALAKKNIDTGAGLERIAMILQGVNNSFETNELNAILTKLADNLGTKYGSNSDHDLYLKIITDHLRCLSFLIADGVRPSNMGRGYVLRMIIRRAARFLYLLRSKADAFLYTLTDTVVENYSKAYPELKDQAKTISETCQKEEEAFAKTITNGLAILEEKLDGSEKTLSGDFVFDLYSTYGFPLELTREIAEEKGLKIDEEAYEKAKEKHSEVSGTGAFEKSVISNAQIAEILKEHGKTEFLGYDNLEAVAKLIAVFDDKAVLDKTPFYAESGGQLADHGMIGNSKVLNVKSVEGVFLHELDSIEGLAVGDMIEAKVDAKRREMTLYHHTTCHLLQAALRKVLGDQIQQMGSQVGPEYTRFDFNLDRAVSKDELKQVEDQVNEWISKKLPVTTKVMAFDDAVKAGALSFFEEKYEDEVRVLFIGDDAQMASVELCGGTHVSNIGDIGEVIVASEGSIASGIRRIRMLANKLAKEHRAEQEELAKKQAAEEAEHEKAKQEAKVRKKEQAKEAFAKSDEILASAMDAENAKVIILNINDHFKDGLEAEVVKSLVENLVDKIESSGNKAVVLAAANNEGKAVFIAAASQDLVKDKESPYNASNIVKQAAQVCGGGGGGRPNFAQAGAKDITKINQALDSARNLLLKNG